MTDNPRHTRAPGRRSRTVRGGRAVKLAARGRGIVGEFTAWIDRKIPYFEVLDGEALELIEHNADTVLEEIGVEFRDFPRALELWKDAGADVDGERVHFPRGMCRSLVRATAPSEYMQHARNPRRSTIIGGDRTVMVPAYGSPFVLDLDRGRRYAAIEDFRNFVKLAYMSPGLHHSGGTICEPVDVPVNKRHFDMVYSHIKYSDKPFMGSVTHPERAEDTVAMARILFGEDFIAHKTVLTSLINANSPLTFDATMLGAATVYAENNQATVISPFLLAGAMSPVTVAGTLTQILAEALAGMAYTQLVRPGAPVVFGSFAAVVSMQSGAPTFGTPEPSLVLYGAGQLARRLGVPFRSGGGLCASKIPDAQAAYEAANTLQTAALGGCELHASHRRLAGERSRDGLRKVHSGRRPGQHDRGPVEGGRPVGERSGPGRAARGRARLTFSWRRAYPGQLRDRVLSFQRRGQTTASNNGSRTARSTPHSGPTGSGNKCSGSTSRRRSIRRSTRRSWSSLIGASSEFEDRDY